ncbi:unnamed protein product, partial [Larinioides sclopetarius]
ILCLVQLPKCITRHYSINHNPAIHQHMNKQQKC